MPVLDLTPEMVGPGRTRLTLAYIESVMLWPHDEEARLASLEAAGAQYFQEQLPPSGPVTVDAVAITRARSALPLPILHARAALPFSRGVIAGMIFQEALHAKQTGRNRNLQQIKSDVRKRYVGKPHFRDLSMSTIENHIWAVYRAAAHLWAAYLHAALGGDDTWPCSLDRLSEFLVLGEGLRKAGEDCITQKPRTLLEPDKTWRTPPTICLPTIRFDWQPLRTSKSI